MPDLPHVQTVKTPPGSVITVRVPADSGPEQTFTLAEELHRQTGLPVVLLDGDADLTVTTPEDAETALAATLPESYPFADWGDDRMRREAAGTLLDDLRGKGWELVRVRQP